MKFTPLHDRIALEPIEHDEKTAGGIIIPDSAKEKPMQGKVVSVGLGARKDNGEIIPMQIKVGDVVLYGKW
ncbi:MAG: co-chaperone GroES, partial [Rickettsiaceae bacterium]|nr:co-chaperone GroES [Rickettsiaceae bacterium]